MEEAVELTPVDVLPLNSEVKTEMASTSGPQICDVLLATEAPNDPPILQDEEMLFTSDGRYICDICGEVSSVRRNAEQHMMAHYEKIAEEGEPVAAVDVNMSDSPSLIKTETDNEMKFELLEVESEIASDPLSLPTNEVQNAVSTISTFAETGTSNAQYTCNICGLVLFHRNSIEQHIGSHFEAKPFECYICTFSTNNKPRIIDHMMTHFGIGLGTKFSCSVCSFESKDRSHLSRHMLTHSDAKPFACDVCSSKFSRKDSLKKHKKIHEKKMLEHTAEYESDSHSSRHTSGSSELEPPNSVAMSSAEEVDSLMTVKLEPTNAMDVQVPQSESKDIPMVQLVVMIENPDETSSLSAMGGQDWDSSRNSESGVQQDDNIITCEFCTYSTNKKYKYKLREHMNIHTGERPFACDLCDSSFSRKRNLDRHKASHSGELPNACKLCDYVAKSQSVLVHHMKTHAGYDTSNGSNEAKHSPNDQSQVGMSNDSQSTTGDDVVMLNSNPSDPLQLRLNEEHSQDSGLSSSSGPKIPSGNKRFKCERCTYKTDRKYEFDVHLRTHTGETPFACDTCNKRYISRKTLNRHKKIHLREKQCHLCDFRTTHDAELATHMKIHIKEDPESHTEPKFQLELREDSQQTPSSSYEIGAEKSFICDLCDKTYLAKRTLNRHIRDCHKDHSLDCRLCDFTTFNKSELADHMKTHSDSLYGSTELVLVDGALSAPSGTNEEHFTCVHCDFECDDITAWSEHMFKHTNEKTLICDQCDFKTKSDANLEAHRALHAEKANTVKVTCEFCNYPFTTKADMNQHLMTCHSELYSSCDVCDFKALNKRSLELHKTTHINIFKCNMCEYKVDKEGLLLRHMMTGHGEVQEYACSSCNYKATNIKDVEQHILTTHNLPAPETQSITVTPDIEPPDTKQYKCYACDFKAWKVALVEQHILSTHAVLLPDTAAPLLTPELSANHVDAPSSSNSVEMYSCYACDFEANNVAQVEQHILTTHNPLPDTTSPMDVTAEAPSSISSL